MTGNITKTIFIFFYLFVSLTLKAQLTADFSISNGGGCVPLTSTFKNLTTGSSANTVYSWDFGNSNISELKDPSAVYLAEGSYTVTLIAKDGNQTSTKTKQVNVYDKPEPDFTFSTAKGCLPLNVNFTSTSKPGDGVVTSYFWDFGDGSISVDSMPVHRFYSSGSFVVRLTALNGKKKRISMENITIKAPEDCLIHLSTSLGDMVIKLYDETPAHRDNFMKLVEEAYFDSLLFHRVIDGFMIQGGDFTHGVSILDLLFNCGKNAPYYMRYVL